jgi:hypothetical protein
MSDGAKEPSWWDDAEIINLIIRVARAGKLDVVNRKLVKIYTAVENGADIGKINDFVSRGKFNGRNVDEMIEQAK